MSRPFISVFGIAGDGMVGDEQVSIAKVAKAATKHGYGVVPLAPGTKRSNLCTFTAAELKAAGPKHRTTSGECGAYHVITDPTIAARVFARVQKQFDEPLNIGVVAGPSRLINIDCDQASEVQAFQNDWATAENEPGYLAASPTCLSPGAYRNQEWKHSNGGHFYFTVPDSFDWESYAITSFKAPGGYEVRWGMQMTVVPPSVRSEGAYLPLGDVPEAPAFLLAAIEERNAKVLAHLARQSTIFADDNIAAWSMGTPWADLLIPDEWTDTTRIDKCGCPIFEKPGGGSSSFKSATGHENTCERWENIEGHGPLHLWTTDPPAPLDTYLAEHGQTITKLRYVALTQHDDDVLAAKEALGIDEPSSEAFNEWLGIRGDSSPEALPLVQSQQSHESPESQESRVPESPESPTPTSGIQGLGDSTPETTEEVSMDESPDESPTSPTTSFWLDHEDAAERSKILNRSKEVYIHRRASEYLDFMMASSVGTESMTVVRFGTRETKVVEPDVGHREDGVPMLYRGRVNTIFGPSEAGKSWFAIYCIKDVLERGGRVLFLDVEDDYDGFSLRIEEIGAKATEENCLYARLWTAPSQSERMAMLNMAKGCDLVVVDSFDGLLGIMQMDGNHATSIRNANSLLKQIAVQSNAALLLVDHTSEKNDSNQQLGSSAKKQVVDGASYRAEPKGRWKKGSPSQTMILAGKDRHGFAKAHATFENEGDEWGRMGLLRIMPGWPEKDGYVLDMLKPPSFTEDPAVSVSQLTQVEDAIIEVLRAKAGEWQPRTACYQAGGDKNNRQGMQQRALDQLVAASVLEYREVPIRGGKTGFEYRYVDLED